MPVYMVLLLCWRIIGTSVTAWSDASFCFWALIENNAGEDGSSTGSVGLVRLGAEPSLWWRTNPHTDEPSHVQWNPSGKAGKNLIKVAKLGPFPRTIIYKSCLFYPSWQATSFESPPSWVAFTEGFHCIYKGVYVMWPKNAMSPEQL